MKLTRSALITAAVIVVLLDLLGLIIGLPGWAVVLLSVAVLVALAMLGKEPEPPKPAPTPPPPAPARTPEHHDPVFSGPPTRTISNVRIPSASADFSFVFSAVVQWSTVLTGSRHADLGSVAVDALLSRARALTAAQQPTEVSLNQHRLAALLGEPDLDERGQVRTWATEVRLRLPDADSKHLEVLAALHRREQTTLLERRMERDKRAYFKDDVLSTPGSAMVWWLVNHPGEVEKCVDLLGTLTRLSAVANNLPLHVVDQPDGESSANGLVPAIADTSTAELAALVAGDQEAGDRHKEGYREEFSSE